ncbi:uncharacterized protein LOC123537917 [Mercenaria mercenaria]|uniref:uncharacterized protein LOC123537917 n=1 Tax=Mercenaria mercenaria TaxID=6596 RepID=UPI001E1D26C4|nr:uncharacterized protein LOC123537917 [Mercenaria mercenaria]
MSRLHTLIFLSALLLNGVQMQSETRAGHDPVRFSSLQAFPWVPVQPLGFWSWRSARFAAREILSLSPGTVFNVYVTSAWGTFWNAGENRFGMYYVHFVVRYKMFPFSRYQCAAWVHWPPPSDVHLDGSPFSQFNYCVPF